jgi:hypothetical protein
MHSQTLHKSSCILEDNMINNVSYLTIYFEFNELD